MGPGGTRGLQAAFGRTGIPPLRILWRSHLRPVPQGYDLASNEPVACDRAVQGGYQKKQQKNAIQQNLSPVGSSSSGLIEELPPA